MKPVVFAVLIVAVLGGTFFALKPNSAAPQVSNPTKVFEIVVRDRKVVSGPTTLAVIEGDVVTIRVTTDEDTELHLHGYDKHIDLTKNEPGEFSFTANLSGRFPYELEESKTDIGTLEVTPK